MYDGDEYLEEDGRTFTLDTVEYDNSNSNTFASPKRSDVELNLQFAKESSMAYGGHHDEHTGIQEQSILVVFELPDGSTGECNVGI